MKFMPPEIPEVYHWAAREYAERVMQSPSTIAVYQLGAVNYPGMSDLDLIVVVKSTCDDVTPLSVKYVLQDDPRLFSVFLHDVAVFDEKTYRDLHSIYYISQLHHLAGKVLDFDNQSGLKREACIANIIEFSLPRIHRIGQLLQEKADPEILLLLSFSYAHTAKLAEEIGISHTTVDFCKRAKALRRVMRHRSEADILSFCSESRSMFARTLNAAADLLLVQEKTPSFATLFDDERRAITFFGKCNNRKALYGNRVQGIHETTWLVTPSSLYWYFCLYAQMGGAVGIAAQRALSPICERSGLAEPFRSFLQDRATKLNRRVAFLTRVKGFFSDVMPYPGFRVM